MSSTFTKEWSAMQKLHLTTFPTCQVCDDDRDPVVHHLRYRGKRGQSEKPGDLMTLCAWHHDDLHRSLKKHKLGLIQGTVDYVRVTRVG